MSKIHIRKANVNDNQEVFELARNLATSFTVEWKNFTISFDNILKNEGNQLIVAEEKGRIIGYLLGFDHFAFYANGRISWVEEIYVSPNERKKGIGKQLMDEFEAWAIRRNSKLVALATRRADQFYKAIGYKDSAIYFKKSLIS